MMVSSLWSSYGPHGRSKLVRSTGTVFITRDGEQMLEHLSESQGSNSESIMRRMLLRACMGVSRRQGDGSLGTLVVLDSLLRDWANPSGTGGVSDTEETSMQHGERVRCIMALNAMSFVVHHSEREIAQMMVGSGLWIRLNEVKWVRGLWMALLVPALNARSALGLEQLLWNWVGAENLPGLLHR